MYTKRLMQVLLAGTLLVMCGCSSFEITANDVDETTRSDAHLSIDTEVSFSPDNTDATIKIALEFPGPGWFRLEVLNVTGHPVALLADEFVVAGSRTISWDATNDDGEDIKTGIYFYRLEWESEVTMKTLVYCITPEECEGLLDEI